ncbi:MAG: FlgD immunoglobulin-like domain containing protein [Bacteroidota bacterium]
MMRRFFFIASLLALCLGSADTAFAQFVESKITANDSDPNDRFGESVAIDGTTAVIGAFRDDDAGADAGAAYVFDLSNGVWTQTAKLIPDDGAILPGLFDNGLFGGVVAINNDVIVVGAVDARENGIKTGAAYVFGRNNDGKWLQEERLIAEDGALNDKYGAAVATNGDYVMVGALDADHSNLNNPGAVYVYLREMGAGDADVTWTPIQKLIPGDTQEGDSFGWSVAMSGDRAIIGARDVDDRGENAGAAYIYELRGSEWVEVTKIYADDAQADDSFGEIVAIHENQAIVGARDVDVNGEESGAAYIFTETSDVEWQQTAKLLASDGESLDRFGNSVAIENNYAVVSTRIDNDFSGAVYVYQQIGASWAEIAKLTPENLEAGDLFGQGVAISDTRIISGTKGDDEKGLDAGAAHVFALEDPDRAALIALYNATNGPNWSRKNNWLSNAPLANWFGVETNDDGQVTELNLENNNLTGDFPVALGGLPALRRLNLRNNNLTGQVSDDLQGASLLETIDVGDNNLTLPLPESLTSLPNLQNLFLDNNNFAGEVPEFLSDLPSLQVLYLNDNAFAGIVPEKMGSIATLRVLHLQNNTIVDLPAFGIDNAQPNLNELYVFNNLLTFEDLEIHGNINDFQYVPQPNIGEARTLIATENNPLVLQVETEGVNNAYQWKKDGAVIQGATEDTYVISSASPADAGTYVLEVTNSRAPDLTLVSEPITVNVIPVVNFASNLSSIHVVPPLLSPANGNLTATLVGSQLSIAGVFESLAFNYGAAYLHAGAPGVSTPSVYELNASLTDERAGVFEAANNTFELNDTELLTLQNGLFYISIETESGNIADPFTAELRGQIYVAPNSGPNQPEISAPADGQDIDLGEPGNISISWSEVSDPDGHPVQYLWVFSRNENFENDMTLIDGIFTTGDAAEFVIPHADIDAFLASQGIAQGATVTLYHLVGATDGSEFTRSTARSINLKRSTNNQPPRVESPVADFNYLLEDGQGNINLADVFLDPDGDDLTFEAGSSEPGIATVAIDDESLVITPVALGSTTINISATDSFDEQVNDEFVLTINSRPAVINAIADQVLFESDAPQTLPVANVFSDNDPLTLSASANDESVINVMLDGTSLVLTPVGVGFSSVTLTAEDDKGGVASTSFQVVVQADMIMPPQSLAESISISFGNPDLSASYRLVALPGTVNLPMSTAVNGTPEVDWIAFRDNGQDVDDREVYFERYDGSANFTFRPGGGFWLLSKLAWERAESRPTVQLAGDGTYTIPLQAGWNIISNPFDIDIPWQAVAQANEVSQQLFRWQGRYIASPVFSSATTGNAFYFFNNEGLNSLRLPYIAASTANIERPVQPAFAIHAVVAGDTLTSIRAGRHIEATEAGADKFDQIAPPGAFETVSLRLLRPGVSQGGRQGYLTEEFLPAERDGYRYTLTLQAPTDGPITLQGEGFPHFENHQEILLIDRKLGKRYDFRKNPSLTFWPDANVQQYVLLIGDAAFVEEEQASLLPESLALLPNYPNPFAQTTTIEFALPEPENVRIVVYNTLGQRVRVLVDGAYSAGHHQLTWDGMGDAGAALSSGLYFYQLQLQDKQIVRSMMLRR